MRLKYYSTGTVGLSFFFVSLFLSLRRRSPSPQFNHRAVWPIPPTIQTAQSVSKTITGQRRAGSNGGGRPGSSGGVDRNCFKNINRKTTDYLGSHSVCFFVFFSIKKEGEISPNPTSGTIVAFEAKVVLLASDGDEERAWRRGRGGLGVEAGAPPVGQEVSVKGGVEETGEGVAVHQGVNLELGLLVHQVAGLGQGLVYSFSDPRVQTHLGQERNRED